MVGGRWVPDIGFEVLSHAQDRAARIALEHLGLYVRIVEERIVYKELRHQTSVRVIESGSSYYGAGDDAGTGVSMRSREETCSGGVLSQFSHSA